jgi:hypothetical protein
MPEQSLGELKQLSVPALRHAELVNLARIESPNKAYELASVRWPRRQAKATRSLAILRRDYGVEALEAFLMEHARPQGSEHAQGEDEMQLDTFYPVGMKGVVFLHKYTTSDPETLQLRHLTGDGAKDVKLSDEVARLGLDVMGTKVLVHRVINSMLDQWATPKVDQPFGGSMWAAAVVAVRTYLPEETELLKKVLLATVVYEGGHERGPIGLMWAILPKVDSQKTTLQDVVNYLLEIGCTEQEVRAAWVEMLKLRQRRKFIIGCITEWWKKLKFGKHGLNKDVDELARQLLLYELNDILVNGCADWNQSRGHGCQLPEDYLHIIDFLLSQTDFDWHYRNEETMELIESYFVQSIARGKVGTAFYMLARYGHNFGICGEHDERDREKRPEVVMVRLMRAAIDRAEESRNYGIAAALAEHIGEMEVADRNREIARSLKQLVALDFAFYHSVDMHK